MNKETESVINFLRENKEMLDEYIKLSKRLGNEDRICYSGLLSQRNLNGTTKEGVMFSSSAVSRSDVTNYIKEQEVLQC